MTIDDYIQRCKDALFLGIPVPVPQHTLEKTALLNLIKERVVEVRSMFENVWATAYAESLGAKHAGPNLPAWLQPIVTHLRNCVPFSYVERGEQDFVFVFQTTFDRAETMRVRLHISMEGTCAGDAAYTAHCTIMDNAATQVEHLSRKYVSHCWRELLSSIAYLDNGYKLPIEAPLDGRVLF